MNNHAQQPRQGRFSNFLKNLFWIFLILQIAPIVLDGVRKQIKEKLHPKTNVGCLRIREMLTDSSFYVKQIHKFLKDDEIKGLLLKIDSPGGYPGAPQAIFNELKKFKKKKPVVSLVENICASGSYYVAMASNDIIASPSALVGSIGVYLRLPNLKGTIENYQAKVHYIQSGKYKTAGDMFKDLLPEEQAELQGVADDTYNQFVKDAASARKLPLEQKSEWANGRVFTGTQGLDIGLIDQIGSQTEAIEQIKKRMAEYGFEIEEECRLVYPQKPSKLQMLLSEDAGDEGNNVASSIAGFISSVWHHFVMQNNSVKTEL